jgi:hypothetical protein
MTLKALVSRINRELNESYHQLHKTRGESSDLGEWYVVNHYDNVIVQTYVNPMELANELSVISPNETVEP